jgi:uncharacterized protein involved in exopolysaccharide biosynthesis
MVAVQPDIIELVEYHPWRRFLFFLVGFGVCAVATLAFVFTRPPEYTAVSQLRLVPATMVAARDPVKPANAAIDLVEFRTEAQVLTSQAVLQDAVARLKNAGGLPELGADPVAAVQHVLRARPIADTQVVELSAVGTEPHFLTRLLDTVAQSWLDRATHLYQQQISDENRDLTEKADDLQRQTTAARARLDRFRDVYGILPNDDEDSLAVDLRNLSASYTAALTSLNASDGNSAVAALDEEAAALRDQLRDLERRITPANLKSDPESKNLLDRLAALDRQIAAERETKLRPAETQFNRLSRDVSTMKKIAADFAAHRSEYDVLLGDVEHAEKLERAMLDRVANLQAIQREGAPRLDILQAAKFSAAPASQNYGINASIALVASLGAGILAAFFSTLLKGAPAVAWSAPGRPRYTGFQMARLTHRAGTPDILDLKPKRLPAPTPD